MYAMPERPNQQKQIEAQMKRVNELMRDGYIECVNQRWQLTDKGWRTLSAAADSKPNAPQRPTKLQMENEILESKLTIHLVAKMLRRG